MLSLRLDLIQKFERCNATVKEIKSFIIELKENAFSNGLSKKKSFQFSQNLNKSVSK